jgi:hypothetical protein
MAIVYGDFDVTDFWDNRDYAIREYVGEPLTDELLTSIALELGYKLPAAYVELMKCRNGGVPKLVIHRTLQPTCFAPDFIAVTGIFGINGTRPSSLGGNYGSKFWMEEWGYPAIGVYFADCPSAGHDMLCLDYRQCGVDGEPQVVHVDQAFDYKVTFVAKNFEAFIRGLESEEAFR